MAEEVVGRVALSSRERQAEYDDGREIRDDDRDVERSHGYKCEGPRNPRALMTASGWINVQTVNDDPQPQPPDAFGFSNANPDSWKLLL